MRDNLVVTLTRDQLRALVAEELAAALARAEGPREVLTVEQAADLLQLHPDALRKSLRRGATIPAHKIGREWRFRRSELLAWLSQQQNHEG